MELSYNVKMCIRCGRFFVEPFDEYVEKFSRDMRPPKRCPACRKYRRENPDKYEGWQSTMMQYPATHGHRHTVHGGN